MGPSGGGAIVTFSQLKGFRLEKLRGYRAALVGSADARIDWRVFDGHPFRMKGTKEVEALQLADITASALFRAVEPDRFGNVEPRYAEELTPKLCRPESLSVPRRPVAIPG